MAKNRSVEVKAGIVVLAGLVVLAIGMFLVSGGEDQFKPKAYYTILFKNSGGIGDGDTVLLDGRRVGYVHESERIKRPSETGDEVLRFIAVTIEIDEGVEIPVDSEFVVTQTITKIITLEISSGTSPELADADTELRGERLQTFEQTIHKAGRLMGEARDVVRNVNGVVKKVDRIVADVDINRIQDNINEVLVSLGRSAGKVETILDDAREPIRETLDNARRGTGDLAGLASELRGDWPGMRTKVHSILDNTVDATGDVRGVVRENRETIKSFLQKLDDAATRVGPALAKLEKLGNEMTDAVVEVRPQLTGTVKAARKAMENFEALTNDLKSAPWKLVNKPSGDEASAILLFNAAQLYVEGANEVSKTIEDLETLRELGVLEDPEQAELVSKLLARMERALADFDAHEKKFVGMLVETAPASDTK